MPWIPTTNGPMFEVDEEDYSYILSGNWIVNKKGHIQGRLPNNRKTVQVGRVIAERIGLNMKGFQADHEEGYKYTKSVEYFIKSN